MGEIMRSIRAHGLRPTAAIGQASMVTNVTLEKARYGSVSIERSAWRALAASWLGWMFDGYETYALILVMAVASRQLLPPERLGSAPVYMAGLLSATLLGWAVGGVIAGVLTDYIGRRRMLMLSILWYAVFTGLTALSPDYCSLLIFRFLTGLGLGAEWGPGCAIVAEFWPPSSRGRAGGALHAAHGVGNLLASTVWLVVNPLGPSSWRYMFVIGVAPAFLLLYIRRVVHDKSFVGGANRQYLRRVVLSDHCGVHHLRRRLAAAARDQAHSDLG